MTLWVNGSIDEDRVRLAMEELGEVNNAHVVDGM